MSTLTQLHKPCKGGNINSAQNFKLYNMQYDY